MNKILLVKFASEITLKGLNRRNFEDTLIKNIKRKIGKEVSMKKDSGRLFIEGYSEEHIDLIRKTFGILSVSVADVVEKEVELIGEAAVRQLKEMEGVKTFKVETKRGDKNFPLNSLEISRKIGGIILSNVNELSVDVHKPDIVVRVEVRDRAYVYSKEIKGVAGMPYSSAGKGALLLSGGIDSPVAGYMMAKRGLEIVSVYFHSHPYTSERAKEKVVELARILSEYTSGMKLYIVPFTKIQMDIIEKCRHDELTIIMRRYMMMIAERISKKEGGIALVTGESLGQVASQTLESMFVTNHVVEMPVFRPLVGMDKTDIIDISREIGTYETSILPYEDCCTIFVPKHPKTKPRLEDIESSEEKVEGIEEMLNEAIENAEVIRL
ncbi:tRNA uracil 4-sulfurtransferase ThiI [Clostridium cylindrosporum]|uniref:Probable tRNA sulfurtransferase n=1 Tax=Clostridium cylindrosporum DSM 605 TaxID=1121307 RepID=A0A0J8D962_CLOCY|nr:tRNA uracil 4-sulfurtransferase ThiI [Clostridium cylindrosporum]KMT20879.1 putative tRNA sulfurtransferase ThiI [Clostridium cylindrosporum DSM 605]